MQPAGNRHISKLNTLHIDSDGTMGRTTKDPAIPGKSQFVPVVSVVINSALFHSQWISKLGSKCCD